jgi:DNA-binding LytR/AlgR family response regulator
MTAPVTADPPPRIDLDTARASLLRAALQLALAIAAFAAYCIGYTLITDGVVYPWRSITWAATTVMPWAACWPWLRRAVRRAGAEGALRWPAVVAPLAIAAVASAALERASALALHIEHGAILAQLVFRKTPVVIGFSLATWLYVHAIAARRERQDAAEAGHVREPLRIPDSKSAVDVRPCDIDWVKAAGNYLELYTGGQCHLVRQTLKSFAAERGTDPFVRIHRSILVHRGRIAGLEHRQGRLIVRMQDGRELPVGRAFRADVERALGG